MVEAVLPACGRQDRPFKGRLKPPLPDGYFHDSCLSAAYMGDVTSMKDYTEIRGFVNEEEVP